MDLVICSLDNIPLNLPAAVVLQTQNSLFWLIRISSTLESRHCKEGYVVGWMCIYLPEYQRT